MNKKVNYLKVWDDVSCGNTYQQFHSDCVESGYGAIESFPSGKEPRIAIAAETSEILKSSPIYKQISEMYFI